MKDSGLIGHRSSGPSGPRERRYESTAVLMKRWRWRSRLYALWKFLTWNASTSHSTNRSFTDPSRERAIRVDLADASAALMHVGLIWHSLACPRCGRRLRLVALIEQASVVPRILRHLGLPTEVPEPRPPRAPPRRLETLEDQSGPASEFDAAW